MSITTKTGDAGLTGLLFNRRVPKHHPRVEAAGTVDELNSTLGLARASEGNQALRPLLLEIQNLLVGLMGELATLPEDRARYRTAGLAVLVPAAAERLHREILALEQAGVGFSGWVMPGENPASATLDAARTVCRRAERTISALAESDPGQNPEILIFLNRLSDLLWLLARAATRPACPP